MKVLGITGGIGCGKSMVIDLMKEEYSCYVINTDRVAYELMQPGNKSYDLIVAYFGEEILEESEQIDRKKLADRVFKSERELLKLNSFTHPMVREYIIDTISKVRKEALEAEQMGEQYEIEFVIVETALPYEARLKDYCDEIWYITASLEVRKERLMMNRGYSVEKVTDILNKQLSDLAYQDFCSHVISNNTTKEDVLGQIRQIIEK